VCVCVCVCMYICVCVCVCVRVRAVDSIEWSNCNKDRLLLQHKVAVFLFRLHPSRQSLRSPKNNKAVYNTELVYIPLVLILVATSLLIFSFKPRPLYPRFPLKTKLYALNNLFAHCDNLLYRRELQAGSSRRPRGSLLFGSVGTLDPFQPSDAM
jgi:hypothetical protein